MHQEHNTRSKSINKNIIEHLPPTIIRRLHHFFNASLGTGKLLERIIIQGLVTHLENNNLHYTRRHSIRPHRATENAIALTCEEITPGFPN